MPNIQKIQIDEILDAHRVHKDIEANKSLVFVYYRVDTAFAGQSELSEEHLEWRWADKQILKELTPDASQLTILKAMQGG